MVQPSPVGGSKRRRLAAALAVVLLVGNVLALVHHVVVRHAVCPEHGESVHASVRERTPGNLADSGLLGQEASVALRPTPHGPNDAEHSHCDVWTCAPRSADVRAVPAVVDTPAVVVGALVVRAAEPGRTPGALFRLAPKNSPPDLSA